MNPRNSGDLLIDAGYYLLEVNMAILTITPDPTVLNITTPSLHPILMTNISTPIDSCLIDNSINSCLLNSFTICSNTD